MKLWLLNPRMIERRPPGRPESIPSILCVVDCPCGVCGVPVVLPAIAAVTFPAFGEVLTQLQWRQLLNNYRTDDGLLHRDIPGVDCRWVAICRAGRLFKIAGLDGEGVEDDSSIRETRERIQEVLEHRRNNGNGNSLRNR